MKDERLWTTLPKLFELGYELYGVVAEKVYMDMENNRLGWQGWSSWDDKYSYDDMVDICENYLNRHSALDIGQERIYTSLPTKIFLHTGPIYMDENGSNQRDLMVHGAIWSNGMLWEEMHAKHGRNLNLLVDKTTVDAFDYRNPSFDTDSSVTILKQKLWEERTDEEETKAIEENTKNNTNA